jgi:excisionase family DNA binding protein
MSSASIADAEGWPPILTTADAARLLQVHPEYLRKLVREGKVPCHRFPGGREMRFLRDELLDWLRDQPGEDGSPSVADAGWSLPALSSTSHLSD